MKIPTVSINKQYTWKSLFNPESDSSEKNPFWTIAHMTNSIDSVNWAMNSGAVGLEVDLHFDGTGKPTEFKHGFPCDCTCYVSKIFVGKGNVCKHLNGCSTSVTAEKLLNHMATFKNKLALVIIDSKLSKNSDISLQINSGKKVIDLLEKNLFEKGYFGNVIVGAPYKNNYYYLKSAAETVNNLRNKNRYFFSIDGEESDIKGVISTLMTQVPSQNRVYGTGISACAPKHFKDEMILGELNRQRGNIGFVYTWTIDKDSSMKDYIRKGAQGILTNYPGDLSRISKSMGYRSATPSDIIPPANNNSVNNIVTSYKKCDCNYKRKGFFKKSGCKIGRNSGKNLACKCNYTFLWTCSGEVVKCLSPSANSCINPDLSKNSCWQGGGDCGGY